MSAFRIAAIGCLLLLADAAAANRNLLQTVSPWSIFISTPSCDSL